MASPATAIDAPNLYNGEAENNNCSSHKKVLDGDDPTVVATVLPCVVAYPVPDDDQLKYTTLYTLPRPHTRTLPSPIPPPETAPTSSASAPQQRPPTVNTTSKTCSLQSRCFRRVLVRVAAIPVAMVVLMLTLFGGWMVYTRLDGLQ